MYWHLCYLLLLIGVFEDFSASTRNALQLTCITRRITLVFLTHHFVNGNLETLHFFESGGILVSAGALALQANPALSFAPILVSSFSLLFRAGLAKSVFSWEEVQAFLLISHLVVAVGFWIGVLCLDKKNECAFLIQGIRNEPWRIMKNLRYFVVLSDHGGTAALFWLGRLPVSNYKKLYSPVLSLRLVSIYSIYFLLVFLFYSFRKRHYQEEKKVIQRHLDSDFFVSCEEKSLPAGVDLQKARPRKMIFLDQQVCSLFTTKTKSMETLWEWRRRLTQIYSSSVCTNQWNAVQIANLLKSTGNESGSVDSFVKSLVDSEFPEIFWEKMKTPTLGSVDANLNAMVFLLCSMPYDLLYPKYPLKHPLESPFLFVRILPWSRAFLVGVIVLFAVACFPFVMWCMHC